MSSPNLMLFGFAARTWARRNCTARWKRCQRAARGGDLEALRAVAVKRIERAALRSGIP